MGELEQTGSYIGRAELWLGDDKISDVEVNLASFVDVEIVRTAGRTERVEGLSSWGGRLTAGHWAQVTPGESLELRLPDRRSGHVFLGNTAGELVGASKAPFGD